MKFTFLSATSLIVCSVYSMVSSSPSNISRFKIPVVLRELQIKALLPTLIVDHLGLSLVKAILLRAGVALADLMHKRGVDVIGWDTEFAIDWRKPGSR